LPLQWLSVRRSSDIKRKIFPVVNCTEAWEADHEDKIFFTVIFVGSTFSLEMGTAKKCNSKGVSNHVVVINFQCSVGVGAVRILSL